VLRNDPAAIRSLDQIVQERVLGERVIRVKIWTRAGRIVYSDEPRLIGSSYRLGAGEQRVLSDGSAQAEHASRSSRGHGWGDDQLTAAVVARTALACPGRNCRRRLGSR